MLKGVARGIGAQGPQGAQGAQGAQGGGGMVIGDPVTGATPNCVLFVDADGKLAQDAGFLFDHGDPTAIAAGLNIDGGEAEVQWYLTSDTGSVRSVVSETDDSQLTTFTNSLNDNLRIGFTGATVSPNNVWGLISGANAVFTVDPSSGEMTLPFLAGTGTRAVVVDANGKLSAP